MRKRRKRWGRRGRGEKAGKMWIDNFIWCKNEITRGKKKTNIKAQFTKGFQEKMTLIRCNVDTLNYFWSILWSSELWNHRFRPQRQKTSSSDYKKVNLTSNFDLKWKLECCKKLENSRNSIISKIGESFNKLKSIKVRCSSFEELKKLFLSTHQRQSLF